MFVLSNSPISIVGCECKDNPQISYSMQPTAHIAVAPPMRLNPCIEVEKLKINALP
jgi:hypothetical protein